MMTKEVEQGDPSAAEAGRIGLVAGGGALPAAISATLAAQGADPFVAVIGGERPEDDKSFADVEHVRIELEDAGHLLSRLRRAGVKRVILAGSIRRRPRFLGIRWSLPLLMAIPRFAKAYAQGDDGLLRGVIALFEGQGMQVVGAQDVVPNLLAPEGILTQAGPIPADRRDMDAASQAALAIGALDIGQGAIAVGGRVVALEGIEGTDGLLERMVALRGHGRLAGKVRGVLVKRCKPQQDLRADLPAIGPDTIRAAHQAGLVGVVVEAKRSFILDFDETIRLADELGLFVLGLSPGEEQP